MLNVICGHSHSGLCGIYYCLSVLHYCGAAGARVGAESSNPLGAPRSFDKYYCKTNVLYHCTK